MFFLEPQNCTYIIIFIATEPECDFPETMGDDYGDDDMPDMGEVSVMCNCSS